MGQSEDNSGKLVRVDKCLYRLTSTGMYYAVIRHEGKNFRRSLETKTRSVANRKQPRARRQRPAHPGRRFAISRKILVRVSPTGEISVEAEGFQGKGCEAATKAIEDALGKPRERTRKPDFWRQSTRTMNQQQLGEG